MATKRVLVYNGSDWTGRGGVVIPAGVDRSTLTPGAYKPNSPDVVGLIPGQPITSQVFPTDQSTPIALSASSYANTIFWGQVTFGNAGGTTLTNCILAGFDPDVVTAGGALSGNFKSFDSATVLRPHVTMYDCLISSAPWRDNSWGLGRPLSAGATRTPSPLGAGFHGGGFSLYRCEVTDVQDGVNYTNGHASSFCLIEASYFHKTWYQNGWTGTGSPADGHTHSDFFQFNRGKTIEVRHSLFGGPRDQAAYDRTPPTGSNDGEDTYGAGFMCKQEVAYTAYDQIHDVIINHNWIYGCGHGINMVYVAARPTLWADCAITNNIFSNVMVPDVYRLKKSDELTPTVSGNIIEETGAAVPMVSLNDGE